MNLHQIVRGAISAVNPDVTGSLLTSIGYTTASNGKQVPTYAAPATMIVQEQPLSGDELKHLDSLNIQGVLRGFWMNGNVLGASRPNVRGGDLLTVPSGSYLIVHVIETWTQAGWCHVVGALQP